jgi:hypothetical protein
VSGFYQSNAGKKEDGTQYTINNQHFNLVIGSLRIYKQGCCVYQSENAEYCQYNSKDPLNVHSCSFYARLQKGCHDRPGDVTSELNNEQACLPVGREQGTVIETMPKP